MGYTPLEKEEAIKSGHSIAELLNSVVIERDGHFDVRAVQYADATDSIVFTFDNADDFLVFPRENFSVADWDEDDDGNSFYVVIDNMDVHHILKFFRNESLEVMRQVKELL